MEIEKFIKTPNENRVAKEVFRDYTTKKMIDDKLYPEREQKTVGEVSKIIKKWRTMKYITDKKNSVKKIIIIKKTNTSFPKSYDGFRFNLNFLFDYLKSIGVKLNKTDKDDLKLIFDIKEVREFIYYWNKELNQPKYEKKKKQVYKFEKYLPEILITFFRCIYFYREYDLCMNVFDNQDVREYFKIAQIIRNFKFPKDEKGRLDREVMHRRNRLYHKIEITFNKFPSLKVKYASIDVLNMKDITEKKIIIYLGYGKKNSQEVDEEEFILRV